VVDFVACRMSIEYKVLLLIIVANAAPILAWSAFDRRLGFPFDGGMTFFDGRPLLGASKTVRGVVVSIASTVLVAPLLGIPWATGALIAGAAMLGDTTSSFIKRRLKLPPSGKAPGLDQIPECLLPLLAVKDHFALTAWDIGTLLVAFALLDLLVSPALFKLHIRRRPY
jgi:hypothetical protein